MSRTTGNVTTLQLVSFLAATPQAYEKLYEPLAESFDACVVMLPEALFTHADELIERLDALLTRNGQMSIFVMNDRPLAVCLGFTRAFVRASPHLLSESFQIAETCYIQSGRFRWRHYRAVQWLADRAADAIVGGQTFRLVLLTLGRLVLAPATYLANIGVRPAPVSPLRIWSSVLLQLRRSDRRARVSPSRFATGLAGNQKLSYTAPAAYPGPEVADDGSDLSAATSANARRWSDVLPPAD
jgi:hypothetical protein